METGTLKVNTANIFPIIKKFLYSDHEIFLRELVSNAVDACQKVKSLAIAGDIKHEGKDLKVEVVADKKSKTLTVRDNGIGMTADEIEKYINQIAFSGAEEFVEKYKDAQIIGHFGLGFYSAFMVAQRVEIISLSHRDAATAVYWSCDGSPNFTMRDAEKDYPGTEITLHLAEDSLEFLEDNRIEGILTKYCKFLPVPVQFGMKKEWIEDPSGEKDDKGNTKRIETEVENIINNTDPLWMKKPADLGDEDYKNFYRELYPMTFEEPLFHIHINVDYPFNLTGVLYFPRLKNSFEVQKNRIALYSNQVFITDEVKNILPEFLTLLQGVVDSPDIPLNVSRSFLQEDANVKKISSHITKKVADKLQGIFASDRADYEKKWDDIGMFVHYGMLTEEKFREKAEKFSLFKTYEDKYFTLDELKEKVKETQKDKKGGIILLYASNKEDHHSAIDAARARGYEVLLMDGPLTAHLISNIEMKNTGLHFKRVDADVAEKLIERDDALPSTLSDDEKTKLKSTLEEIVSKEKYMVEFASLSPTDAPFIITQNEFMRRMKEQSAMGGGGGFYGIMPETYNLVANANHPLMSAVMNGEKEKAKQAIDLALLAKGLLKGEALTEFVKRSWGMIQ
ncbi:MAG: molecular chaperone HtpG [Flavobacteriales bacterium]|nr:molecular chaperone HtpG [Flavobacteriales bacterium]